jgi:hypothetical protein
MLNGWFVIVKLRIIRYSELAYTIRRHYRTRLRASIKLVLNSKLQEILYAVRLCNDAQNITLNQDKILINVSALGDFTSHKKSASPISFNEFKFRDAVTIYSQVILIDMHHE